MPEISLWVYRDFENRRVGENDVGPLAWAAHRDRESALREVLGDAAFSVKWSPEAVDKQRPHELAEVVVSVLSHPTAHAVLMGAAAYVGKIVAGQIDDLMGNAVAHIFSGLVSRFKKKKVGDFWLTLPDGSRIQVDANAQVALSLKDGRVLSFSVDSPPAASSGSDGT